MAYAIINVGGQQFRVEEGEHLLVQRLPHEVGTTFEPPVLLVGSEGGVALGEEAGASTVTVRVAEHLRGKKVIVGKHRQRTGFRKRNGFRASLTRIQVESIRSGGTRSRSKKQPAAEPAGTED